MKYIVVALLILCSCSTVDSQSRGIFGQVLGSVTFVEGFTFEDSSCHLRDVVFYKDTDMTSEVHASVILHNNYFFFDRIPASYHAKYMIIAKNRDMIKLDVANIVGFDSESFPKQKENKSGIMELYTVVLQNKMLKDIVRDNLTQNYRFTCVGRSINEELEYANIMKADINSPELKTYKSILSELVRNLG